MVDFDQIWIAPGLSGLTPKTPEPVTLSTPNNHQQLQSVVLGLPRLHPFLVLLSWNISQNTIRSAIPPRITQGNSQAHTLASSRLLVHHSQPSFSGVVGIPLSVPRIFNCSGEPAWLSPSFSGTSMFLKSEVLMSLPRSTFCFTWSPYFRLASASTRMLYFTLPTPIC